MLCWCSEHADQSKHDQQMTAQVLFSRWLGQLKQQAHSPGNVLSALGLCGAGAQSMKLMHDWATAQVLFSRWLGQLKQGLLHGGDSSRWQGDEAILQQIPQHNMRSFDPQTHKLAA